MKKSIISSLKKDGRVREEKAGRQYADDMTPAS
jgi:hypothetical protein